MDIQVSKSRRNLTLRSNKPKYSAFLKIFKYKSLWIAIGFIVLLIVFAHYLRNKKEFDVSVDPTPVIISKTTSQLLKSYVLNPPSDAEVIIYGPNGYGKSRLLQTQIDEIYSLGRLPITLDFTEYNQNTNLKQFITDKIDESLQILENKPVKASLLRLTLRAISLNSTKMISRKHALNALSAVLDVSLHGLEATPLTAIDKFCSVLDLFTDSIRPILFLINPQVLIEYGYSDLFWALFNRGRGRLVAEISDQDFLQKSSEFRRFVTDSPHSIRMVEIKPFSLKLAQKVLSKEYEIFRQSQVNQIYEEFGGIGSIFASVNDYLQSGFTFNEAYQKVKSDYWGEFNATLRQIPEEILRYLGGNTTIEIDYYGNEIKLLEKKGILERINDTSFKITTPALKKRLEQAYVQ